MIDGIVNWAETLNCFIELLSDIYPDYDFVVINEMHLNDEYAPNNCTMKRKVNQMSISCNTRQDSRESEPTLEDILKMLGVPAIPDVDPSDPEYQDLRAWFMRTFRKILKEEGPEKFNQMRKEHLGGWRAFLAMY
jgi:hypothetical protein